MRKLFICMFLCCLSFSVFAFKSFQIDGLPRFISDQPQVAPGMVLDVGETMRPFMCRFSSAQLGALVHVKQYNFKYGWVTETLVMPTKPYQHLDVNFELDHDVATMGVTKYMEFTTMARDTQVTCYFSAK